MDDGTAPLFDEIDGAACKRALAVLLDVGTALAQECKTPAADASLAAPLAERSKAFERVALAVRRTILLFQHLEANLVPTEDRRTQLRKDIIREVEDTIERRVDPEDTEALRLELVERLDSPDFIDELAHHSPADNIRRLCNDLGLSNLDGVVRYRRRTPEDIAILCAQAAAGPRSRPSEARTLQIPPPPAGDARRRVGSPSQPSPPQPPH